MFIIYTDGSSRGNPGRGGWAAIVIENNYGVLKVLKEIGGREEKTTNNRMELTAAIEALKSLGDFGNTELACSEFVEPVEVFSDSTYLINGITKWVYGWQKNKWQTKDKRGVLNKDLWQKLLVQIEKRNIVWKKVLGHSGHKFNDRCDEIATSFADGKKVIFNNRPI